MPHAPCFFNIYFLYKLHVLGWFPKHTHGSCVKVSGIHNPNCQDRTLIRQGLKDFVQKCFDMDCAPQGMTSQSIVKLGEDKSMSSLLFDYDKKKWQVEQKKLNVLKTHLKREAKNVKGKGAEASDVSAEVPITQPLSSASSSQWFASEDEGSDEPMGSDSD